MVLGRTVMMAAAILAAGAAALNQKPDFSGTWTLDPASAPVGDRGRFATAPMTVRQTAERLVVERTVRDVTLTLTYKLDGSDSRNVLTGPDGQRADLRSTATWGGARLTIVSTRDMNGQTVETRQVWSVEGSTLTVERTSPRGTETRVYHRTAEDGPDGWQTMAQPPAAAAGWGATL